MNNGYIEELVNFPSVLLLLLFLPKYIRWDESKSIFPSRSLKVDPMRSPRESNSKHILRKSTWVSLTTPVWMIPDLNANIENAQVRQDTKVGYSKLFSGNVWSYSLPGYIELPFQEAWMWHIHNNKDEQQIFSLGTRKGKWRKGI